MFHRVYFMLNKYIGNNNIITTSIKHTNNKQAETFIAHIVL